MNYIYTFLDQYIYSKNYWILMLKSCIFFFLCDLLISITISEILGVQIGENTSTASLSKLPFWLYLLIGSLLMPALETTLFQWLPIFVYTYTDGDNAFKQLLFCLGSGIAFGSVHGFSNGYIIATLCVGFMYMAFGFFLKRKGLLVFFPIFLIHAFVNFISLIAGWLINFS